MSTAVKIDFVSDVSCPWCVIGLRALEMALSRVSADITADIHFQPFELNPEMAPEGQDIGEHITQKFGSNTDRLGKSREMIRARGAELGFDFNMAKRGRIYNTFDAHRLLHWADGTGRQQALKHALFTAYFTEGRNPSDHDVLVEVAAKAGLDADRARAILSSNEFADEVRAREQLYVNHGIHGVPAVILNDRYLIEGGQPVEVFERALHQAAAEAKKATA